MSQKNRNTMKQQIIDLVKSIKSGPDAAALLGFIEVETGGKGFDDKTGKLIIQFEPAWYRKKAPYTPSGLWSVNKVDVQSKEWIAFNDAFSKNPDAAMQATSIGLGQIMGFHYRRLGYQTVGAMWDDAKKGIDRQLFQLIQFINTDPRLGACIIVHDWDAVATIYNGPRYKELASKYGREPYDISLEKAYNKYLSII